MQTMQIIGNSNLVFLSMFFLSLLIPRKMLSKMFASLACFGFKVVYLDRLAGFHIMTRFANINILEDESQEYRNILNYYVRQRLEHNDEPECIRRMLEGLLEEMSENTKDYMLVKSKANLIH